MGSPVGVSAYFPNRPCLFFGLVQSLIRWAAIFVHKQEYLRLTMNDKFTPQASLLWNRIPPSIQKRHISNVWCTKCLAVTTIIDFRGQVKELDLVLTGVCKTCGSKAARLIESE